MDGCQGWTARALLGLLLLGLAAADPTEVKQNRKVSTPDWGVTINRTAVDSGKIFKVTVFVKSYVDFMLCHTWRCNRIAVGDATPEGVLMYGAYSRCETERGNETCTLVEERFKSGWRGFSEKEYAFMVEQRKDKLAVWLEDHPEHVATVAHPWGAPNFRGDTVLKIRADNTADISEYPSYVHYAAKLVAEKTRHGPPAEWHPLEAAVNEAASRARVPQEQRAVHWCRLAVATLARPATLDLAFNVKELLDEAARQASLAVGLGKEDVAEDLRQRGVAFAAELRAKISNAEHSLRTSSGLGMDNLGDLWTGVSANASSLAAASADRIRQYNVQLEQQRKVLKGAKTLQGLISAVTAIVGVALSVALPGAGTAAVYGGAVGVGVLSAGSSGIAAEIQQTEAEIQKLEKVLEEEAQKDATIKRLLPLFKTSQQLLQGVVRATRSESSVEVRKWLVSGELQAFRAQLPILSVEDSKAAQAVTNLVQQLTDTANTLAAAMENADSQRVGSALLEQVTPPRPALDVGPLGEDMRRVQKFVSMQAMDRTRAAVFKSLRMYSLPFCDKLSLSAGRNCLSGPDDDLQTVAECARRDYESLGIDVASLRRGRHQNNPLWSLFDAIPGTQPFYSWRGGVVANLLAGKEVIMVADPLGGPAGRYAVKARLLTLRFDHPGTSNSSFNEALKNFKVLMVHPGNSYFRCSSGVVGFSHRVLTLEYSVSTYVQQGAVDGLPLHLQASSDMELLRKAPDPAVSPYTSWRMTLLPAVPGADFAALAPYAAQATVSLVGHGTYLLSARCDECDPDF